MSDQRPLAIFDIDGTLADVAHRVHWLAGSARDYGAFFCEAIHDPPLEQGLALLTQAAQDCDIGYVTGRPEWCRADTLWWLAEHGLPAGPLAMRRNGDHRPARLAKVQLLAELAAGRVIAVVVDDDEAVVQAYRAQGWPVLQATWAAESEVLERAQEQEGRT